MQVDESRARGAGVAMAWHRVAQPADAAGEGWTILRQPQCSIGNPTVSKIMRQTLKKKNQGI